MFTHNIRAYNIHTHTHIYTRTIARAYVHAHAHMHAHKTLPPRVATPAAPAASTPLFDIYDIIMLCLFFALSNISKIHQLNIIYLLSIHIYLFYHHLASCRLPPRVAASHRLSPRRRLRILSLKYKKYFNK
jgi:hypothetical protein